MGKMKLKPDFGKSGMNPISDIGQEHLMNIVNFTIIPLKL